MKASVFILTCLLALPAAYGRTIYVDSNAPGADNGLSWVNAYNFLQDALTDANSSEKPVEIRVAQGLYTPDSNSAVPDGTGDREVTFQLINGITLKGGYCGYGETDPNARNIDAYETVLSGDLDGNDVDVNDPNYLRYRCENSYHVVISSSTDANAVLEGFTITAGNSNGNGQNSCGGGMWNKKGSPIINKCTFIYNHADSASGGMDNSSSSPMVTNCTFIGNSAGYWGGGMCNGGGDPTVTNCTFAGNWAIEGGGMFNMESSLTVTNCTFTANAASTGGGMENYGSRPTVTNCTFTGNTAGTGGGMFNYDGGSHTLTNCTFTGNSAVYGGGGMYNHNSSTTVTNCTFTGNSADVGGGMHTDSSPTVTNCTFTGNTARIGGGICNEVSDPVVTNCTFSGNSAGSGGGMCNRWHSNMTVTNCIFWADVPDEIIDDFVSSSTVNYCDVQDGWAGAGSNNIDADPCFADPGYWADANDPNIIVEPNDPNAFWVDGDYHLRWDSPCIDAGDPNYVAGPNETDLDGRPRVADGDCNDTEIVDMGAYEFAWAYIGDFDGQCDVDFGDFVIVALAWLTEDGQDNYNPVCDISIPADNKVDWRDVKILCDNWLAGVE